MFSETRMDWFDGLSLLGRLFLDSDSLPGLPGPVQTSAVSFLFPCVSGSVNCVVWSLSDERLHQSAEGAAAQQCGGITQRSQVWHRPPSVTWCFSHLMSWMLFWIINPPAPSPQVYDQTSERRGYLQADQKHAAAKLITRCRSETGTIQEAKVFWSKFQMNYWTNL